MADVTDSKSVGGNTVWVQIPLSALFQQKMTLKIKSFFYFFLDKIRCADNFIAFKCRQILILIDCTLNYIFIIICDIIFKIQIRNE